jgi:hypothetical protein
MHDSLTGLSGIVPGGFLLAKRVARNMISSHQPTRDGAIPDRNSFAMGMKVHALSPDSTFDMEAGRRVALRSYR